MPRRALIIVPVLAVLAGCGSKPAATPTASAPGVKPLKVAVLEPGPVSDHGWNGLAHDAGVQLHNDTGAEVQDFQTKSKGDIEAALRDFAARGFDIVVGHGNEYGDPALKIAKEFPNTHFVISSGRVNAANVTSLNYKLTDATYCLGILAAGVSKTGKGACVGGMEIPVVKDTFTTLGNGAKTVKPGFAVTDAYLGNWDDTGAAKQQTATLISQGADVIFHNADAAGLGVFNAVDEAAKSGKSVFAFGSNADQNAIAPNVVLASAVMDLGKTFDAIAQEVKDGKFQGTIRNLGMKEGFVRVSLNEGLKSKIPADVLKKEQDAEAKIKSGALVVKQSA